MAIFCMVSQPWVIRSFTQQLLFSITIGEIEGFILLNFISYFNEMVILLNDYWVSGKVSLSINYDSPSTPQSAKWSCTITITLIAMYNIIVCKTYNCKTWWLLNHAKYYNTETTCDICNMESGDMGESKACEKWEMMKKYNSKIWDTTLNSSIDVFSLF